MESIGVDSEDVSSQFASCLNASLATRRIQTLPNRKATLKLLPNKHNKLLSIAFSPLEPFASLFAFFMHKATNLSAFLLALLMQTLSGMQSKKLLFTFYSIAATRGVCCLNRTSIRRIFRTKAKNLHESQALTMHHGKIASFNYSLNNTDERADGRTIEENFASVCVFILKRRRD